MRKDDLKEYKKPILKVYGNLEKITQAGQDKTGDYAGRYGDLINFLVYRQINYFFKY